MTDPSGSTSGTCILEVADPARHDRGFHQREPQVEHPESPYPELHEEPHDVSHGSHVEQLDVVEQHPLVNPQAASSTSFALNEDGRRFIVALPVRTQGAGRVENSFIEDGENT